MKAILTHSNRKRDDNHTSWSEILAFETEIQDNLCNKTVLLSHNDIDFKDVNKDDLIFVFATGQLDKELKSNLEQTNAQIYFIVQDPNWQTDIRLNQNYTLITPFKELNNLNEQDVYQKLKLITPNILLNMPKKHIYLPFGNMSLTSRYYANQRNKTVGIVSFHKTSNVVYAGSLKEDRKHLFADVVQAYPDIDFIGNFDQYKFEEMVGVKCDTLHFKGRRPANEIQIIYRSYDKVIIMPDRKMIDLDVSYIRHSEMYIGDSKIELFADEDMKDKAHQNMMKTSNQLEDGSYKINIKKLEKEYGLMPQAIQSKLKGSC